MFQRFASRDDLEWFQIAKNDFKTTVCIKKTIKFGFTLFIVIYCDGEYKDIKSQLTRKLITINPFGFLLVPQKMTDEKLLRLNIFSTYSNFHDENDIYSSLGSELTEIV